MLARILNSTPLARAARVGATAPLARAFCAGGEYGGSPAQRPEHITWFKAGKKATLTDIPASGYVTPTAVGVTLAPFCAKEMGDAFGMYRGTIAPGGRIGREIHGQTTETIYVLEGEGRGFIGDEEFDMKAGDCMHVEKNVFHGLNNTGSSTMQIIVVGNPDYG